MSEKHSVFHEKTNYYFFQKSVIDKWWYHILLLHLWLSIIADILTWIVQWYG